MAQTTHSEGTTPAFASIATWCRLSGMGRSSVYQALGRGDLRAVKRGRQTLLDVAHGMTWLRSLPPAAIQSGQKAA